MTDKLQRRLDELEAHARPCVHVLPQLIRVARAADAVSRLWKTPPNELPSTTEERQAQVDVRYNALDAALAALLEKLGASHD